MRCFKSLFSVRNLWEEKEKRNIQTTTNKDLFANIPENNKIPKL